MRPSSSALESLSRSQSVVGAVATLTQAALTRRADRRRGHDAGWALEARLELALLDPQVRREFGLVAPYLFDEALGVLAADEHLKLDAERKVG